jgi:4-amino-4-deoxy-L-arabinose transferase-like glycosyltransferase
MNITSPKDSVSSFFAPRRIVLVLWVVLLFAVGAAIRFYDLTDLPLDFNSTRQLHSAVVARGFYYLQAQPQGLPAWQVQLGIKQMQQEAIIEPPFVEELAAIGYRLAGHEILWLPRIFSILFWLAGAAAIFMAGRELVGTDGAVIGLAYFLILPFGAYASRAFQPEPLMVALLCFSLWAMVRWIKAPTWKWAVAAGLLSGVTILSKVLVGLILGGAWLGLILARQGLRSALRDRKVWLLAALTIIPYGCYHIYGMYINGFLRGQYDARFWPSLWIDPVFYLRWKSMIASTVGFEWFLVALLGCFILRERTWRGAFLGAWTGYFIYGLIVPYHISTHDYYQMPIIPLVALGLAAAAGLLFQNQRGSKIVLVGLVYALVLFTVAANAWDVRDKLKAEDFRSEVAYWQKLGTKIGHDSKVIGLTQDYGYRLGYWGLVDCTPWMTSSDFNAKALGGQSYDEKTLFTDQVKNYDLFVVTMPDELARQPELKILLTKGYAVWAQGSDYTIYDLHHPLQ